MKSLLPALAALSCLLARPARAQPDRINDYNTIGWYAYGGDHRLGEHWTIHTEAQVRRTGFITDWQQWVLRGGLDYQVVPRFKVGGGYAYLNTYAYGLHPVADAGTYPEQRFYEQVQLADQVGYFEVNQRLRLEQRFIGLPGAAGPLTNRAVWQRQNRVRYQLKLAFPLQGPTIDDHELYLSGSEELFVNFGRDVTTNVFDQNRLTAGFAYRIHEGFRLELHYISQIMQQYEPNLRSGFPVFEFNNGFRLGVTYNLTLIE